MARLQEEKGARLTEQVQDAANQMQQTHRPLQEKRV